MLPMTERNSFHCLALLAALGLLTPCVFAQAELEASAAPAVTQAVAPGGVLDALLFYGVGGAAIISAIGVCISKNIVRMAVWLFVALGSVALIYFMLAANFLGAIQLIVYAGGTLILLVFGVMLTSKSPWVRFEVGKLEFAGAAAVCGTLLVSLCLILSRTNWAGTDKAVSGSSIAQIGEQLITTYLVPFEVAGVLLMIVMVGAAHLARQEKP
jgi:NADH:ubiquinone oxidoreductase subunit 6 (subunit J)